MRPWFVLFVVLGACGSPPGPSTPPPDQNAGSGKDDLAQGDLGQVDLGRNDLASADLEAADFAVSDLAIADLGTDAATDAGTTRIGNSVQDPGNDETYGADLVGAFPITVPAAANLIGFGYFPTNASIGHVTMYLYSDSGNQPDKLVAATASTPVGRANRAQEMAPTMPTRLAAGRYWLGLMTDDDDLKPAFGMAKTDYYLAEEVYGPPAPKFPPGMPLNMLEISWDWYIVVN